MANENAVSQSKIYSFEAEQAVLGCILLDASTFSSAVTILRSEYFFYPQHQSIFSIMEQLDLAKGTIDPLLLLDEIRKQNVFPDDAAAKQYLVQLTDLIPSAANIENYCKIVKDKFYIRTLVNISNEIIDMAENSGEEADTILDNAEQRIYDIRQGNASSAPESIESLIKSVYDHLSKLNSEDREKYKGLPTGFPDFDTMCTGLNKSDLVIIGARPAMGKTSFALNMARNVAVKTKKKVLFFSLEMTTVQLAQRVIATEARISSQKMRTGELTPKEWDDLYSACVFLKDVPLYFDNTKITTVPEMKAKIRRLKPDAVFIDYLGLMHSAQHIDNRVQEISDITRNLKLMAIDLMIPIVVCAQLSRGTESRGNKSHKPQLADLRDSGSIEQDADIVAMLYREDYYQNGEKTEDDNDKTAKANLAQLLIEKNRHGPTGNINLAWNPTFTLYTCIDKNQDDQGQ